MTCDLILSMGFRHHFWRANSYQRAAYRNYHSPLIHLPLVPQGPSGLRGKEFRLSWVHGIGGVVTNLRIQILNPNIEIQNKSETVSKYK